MSNYDDTYVSNLSRLPGLQYNQIPFLLSQHQILFPLKTDMHQQAHTAARGLLLLKVFSEFHPIICFAYLYFNPPVLTLYLCLAKPGRISGPVMPYDSGGSVVKDAYDPRMLIRSALPSHAIHPTYYYQQSCGQNEGRSATGAEQDTSLQCKQSPQCGMAAKLAADTAATGAFSNPFFMARVGIPKVGNNDRAAARLQVNAQYDAGAIAATTRRNAGAVEYGMARMY